MGNTILEIKGLTKRYKEQTALKNVSIKLEKGKIYGLIGKNGAGKTTLMRMIAGLGFQNEGTISLFGKESGQGYEKEKNRIGTLIEYPALIGNMSAKENMHWQCLMKGYPDYEMEDKLLELVGMGNAAKKKVKNFSLGMKQRLGIATVLLGNPELLILDEPINGLDPTGMKEIRELLKRLNEQEDKTILISSHNLPELYQTATDYIVIHEGEIKETISHKELDEYCKSYICLKSTDVNYLVTVLEGQLHTKDFKVMPDKSVRLYDLSVSQEKLGQLLYDNQVVVTELSVNQTNLEEYFINVIGGDTND